MTQRLVIVESPAKAKTITKYLPGDCKVVATMGHVIDLPTSKIGIDVENHFAPDYQPIKGKGKILKDIKGAVKQSDEIMLATDPDREGEAISFHLANYLGLDLNDENRIEFHEITSEAIKSAVENKRSINMDLVNAQQARRVLDRLVGYKISPILWKKVMRGLSAGRVQSAATKMIVDRENEIRNFTSEEYWNISAWLLKQKEKTAFEAKLTKIDGKKAEIKTSGDAQAAVEALEAGAYSVISVKKSVKQKKPAPPFTTSTMQQDAFRKINYSTKRTMSVAQQLYEGLDIAGKGHVGLITYMRTDSTRIADNAKSSAREYIKSVYGDEYVGGFVPGAKKGAHVQDAHEAIRPTDVCLTPEIAAKSLEKDQLKLYTLIYNRFLAAMMSNAVYDTVAADIACGAYTLHATGSKLKFAGYLKVYNVEDEEKDMDIPELAEGETLGLKKVASEQKFTQPPARYTEGTLVKALEEQGIGRPSTYAPTIATILTRNYVVIEEKKFKPTDLGEAVNKLMEDNFSDVVNLKFTADMENNLDKIADGKLEWTHILDDFYGNLTKEVEAASGIEKVKLKEEVSDIKCEKCGRNLVVKTGRFGKFLACPGYPECSFTMPLTEKITAPCPKCGGELVVRKTKKGKTFYGCKNYPNCDFMSWNKPTDKKCPKCGSILYESSGRSKGLYCAKEGCDYKEK